MLVTISRLVRYGTVRAEMVAVAIARPVSRRPLAPVLAEVDLAQPVRDTIDRGAPLTRGPAFGPRPVARDACRPWLAVGG